MKGKARPCPPPIVINRRRRWSGVIPDDCSRRTADLFDRFLYQLAILPNPFAHSLAIGIIRSLGYGLNCMPAFIIINHRFAVLGCLSGRLIILINRISNQRPKNGSCSQTDEGSLGIASYRLANKSARTRPHRGAYLGIVPVRGIVGARDKEER
jgi:hypothetical protein